MVLSRFDSLPASKSRNGGFFLDIGNQTMCEHQKSLDIHMFPSIGKESKTIEKLQFVSHQTNAWAKIKQPDRF